MNRGKIAQVLTRHVDFFESAPGPRREGAPFRCQRHLPRSAMNERHPEMPFEIGDMSADGRLRQAKPFGRAPKAAAFREADERLGYDGPAD
jgi:hypothetical protein